MDALGEAGGSEAVPALIKILHKDASARLRGRAAVALGRLGGADAVTALIQAASEGQDEWARRYAVNSLRNLLPTGNDESTTAIRQLLEEVLLAEETPPITREIASQGLEAYQTR